MPAFSKMFRNFAPFGKFFKNKMAKNFTQNNLKHVNYINLAKNSKKDIISGGISTKGQLKERLLGVNVGVVDTNFRPTIHGAGHTSARLGATIGKKVMDLTTRNYAGQVIVGAAAMTSVSIMNGAMNQAVDIMHSRYMNDSRYSHRLLGGTRLGSASGNSPLSPSSTTGLSLALHKSRHN